MEHTLITMEGAKQSRVREIAQALSLKLGVPMVPVEVLQAATIYKDKLPNDLYAAVHGDGRPGLLPPLIGISKAQAGFSASPAFRQRERNIAARLLRRQSLILTGETLYAFCSTGLKKYEVYLYADEGGPSETVVQYPKQRNHGKGYDLKLNSAVLNIDQCVEWIESALSLPHAQSAR